MSAQVAALRAAFDQSFTAQVVPAPASIDYLRVESGGNDYVLALAELAGVWKDRPIVAAPSPLPELLGLANLRGIATPVYSLHGLLGLGVQVTPPRWISLAHRASPVAIAFDALIAHMRLPTTEPVALLSLSPLLDSLAKRCASFATEI